MPSVDNCPMHEQNGPLRNNNNNKNRGKNTTHIHRKYTIGTNINDVDICIIVAF